MTESIRVGDRVTITDVRFPHHRHLIGREGVVRRVVAGWMADTYVVATPGAGGLHVDATAVSRVEEPKPTEPATPPVELPMKNLQAATFAHQLLGPDADLDKLIGVAEFVMDRRTLGTETTGTVGLLESVEANAEEPAVPSTEPLEVTDRDGDKLELSLIGSGNTFAKAWVGQGYVGNGVYLTEADVDAVIARLQQFKAAVAAGLRD